MTRQPPHAATWTTFVRARRLACHALAAWTITTPALLAGVSATPAASEAGFTDSPGAAMPAANPRSADEEARERLNAAVYALREATGLAFRLRSSAEGILAGGTPITDYAITMARIGESGGAWRVKVEGEGQRRPADPPLRVTAVFDEASMTWIDHEARQVHTRTVRTARGPLIQLVHAARVPEILSREPFSKELAAQDLVIESQSELDGVACDVVLARPQNANSSTRWWIGRDDLLPRRVEKSVQSSSGGGSTTIDFIGIRTTEGVRGEDLRVDVPEGYTVVSPDGPAPGGPGLTTRPDSRASQTPGGTTGTLANPSTGATRTDRDDTPLGDEPDDHQAVDLRLRAEDGAEFSLSSLRDRPVVMCFLATWSLPSRAAIARLESVRAGLGDRAHVLALTVRERFSSQAGDFIRARGSTARVVPAGDKAAEVMGIRVLPAVVVLDAGGKIVHASQGMKPTDWDSLAGVLSRHGLPLPPAADETRPATRDAD